MCCRTYLYSYAHMHVYIRTSVSGMDMLCIVYTLNPAPHLDGRITHIVGEMEKLETRRVNFKETYEKQRVDVMSITRELHHMETSLKQKVGVSATIDCVGKGHINNGRWLLSAVVTVCKVEC